MAEYTRPATWEDVKQVARYLEEAGVDYALIGGYALAAHGLVRINDEITIDVLPSAAGCSWDELRPFIQEIVLDETRVRVLSLEGLLKSKTSTRPKDQADAAAIARALEELGRR